MILSWLKKWRAPLGLAALAICGAALFFGVRARREAAARPPLRVLCAPDWLDEDALNDFARRRAVKLNLYTYASAGELVRQMANANGQIDVVCAPSSLLRAFVRSGWLRRLDFLTLPHVREIEADFLHLPYDPRGEFAVPLFWNPYGLFARTGEHAVVMDAGVRLWADELFLLAQLGARAGNAEEFAVDPALRKLLPTPARLVRDGHSAAAILANAPAAFVPLGAVESFLSDAYEFRLPAEGAPLEVALLAVGAHSGNVRLGLDLIDEQLAFARARGLHRRVRAAFVQTAANTDVAVSTWLRPSALRTFPLTQLKFPDLDLDLVPRFERALKAHKILLGQ